VVRHLAPLHACSHGAAEHSVEYHPVSRQAGAHQAAY
jgi:hypothetical protein